MFSKFMPLRFGYNRYITDICYIYVYLINHTRTNSEYSKYSNNLTKITQLLVSNIIIILMASPESGVIMKSELYSNVYYRHMGLKLYAVFQSMNN